MKISLKKSILFSGLILIVLFLFNVFWSTGFFRFFENKFEGEIFKQIKLKGAEDITVSHIDSFAII